MRQTQVGLVEARLATKGYTKKKVGEYSKTNKCQ